MSEKVDRSIDTRPQAEILSHKHRRVKAIGMAKQRFAYPILDASLNQMDREVLYVKIKDFLENFRESDGKPTVEDYEVVARELSCLDAFAVSKNGKEDIAVSDIPRHAKAKSKGASKDPVERALESERSRKRANLEGAKPALTL